MAKPVTEDSLPIALPTFLKEHAGQKFSDVDLSGLDQFKNYAAPTISKALRNLEAGAKLRKENTIDPGFPNRKNYVFWWEPSCLPHRLPTPIKKEMTESELEPIGGLTPEQEGNLTTLKKVLLPSMTRTALEGLAAQQAKRILQLENFQEWMIGHAVKPVPISIENESDSEH